MECAICLEQYKEPKVLLCRHSYCKECLEKLVKKSGERYTITCPECRNLTEIKEESFDVLRSDLLSNNVQENRNLSTKADRLQRVCENCDSGENAVKQCGVCCMQMCAFCTEAHRRTRTTKWHSLTAFEHPKTTKQPTKKKITFCEKHRGEILKFFCQSPSCNHVVCRECLLVDHLDHEYDFVYNVSAMKKITMRKLVDDVKCKAQHVQAVLSTLEEVEEETLQTVKSVNKEIDEYVDDIIQMLEQKRCILKEDVKDISEIKIKQLKLEKGKAALTLASMRNSVEFTERALENSDDVKFLLMEEALTQRLKEPESKDVSTIPTKPLEIMFETTCPNIKEFVGNIAQVSERSNIKEVTYAKSEKCTHNSYQEKNQEVPSDTNALLYDDFSPDYYKLVPPELERVDGFSKDIIDSSTYYSLCTSGIFKGSDDLLSDSTISHQRNTETLPQSPSWFSPSHTERTCASMCEVFRLPGSYSYDKLQLTPQKRSFVLQAKTKDGLLQNACGDKVCVTIENSNGEKEDLEVVDNRDGSYNFDYIPQSSGKYTFFITVNGRSVKEKGFNYEVRNRFRIISDRGL